MKYSLEFTLEILEDGTPEWNDPILIGERAYISEEYEFEYDVWDFLKDETEIKELTEKGVYHVYCYGTVTEEWSDNWEYGREYDGLNFEAESILVSKTLDIDPGI